MKSSTSKTDILNRIRNRLTARPRAWTRAQMSLAPEAEPVTLSEAELPTEGVAVVAKLVDLLHMQAKPPVINLPNDPAVRELAEAVRENTAATKELAGRPTEIHVPQGPAPQVTIEAPVVNVPAPVVHVEAPAPSDVNVTLDQPDRKVKILRDKDGRIIGADVTGG